ncbi:kinase-like protein [Ganoderma leucocontextum]|nr:kinase-like protein [Ganoderma leucocontextum]
MVPSPQSPASPTPPAIGTYIDNGALQLVEILGYGGYGIVYRAVDTFSSNPTSYAVKCLPHSNKRSATRQRQLHMREITLHQLASGHPNVVTLHRVIEDYQYTFIVMDYCPDGDLFTQILHQRRYLGNNALIKEVFLQLLDAVEYCHSLNIYHRDLKPENVLCFENGLRLAITDFGLATTERMSTEFRTGSVYHMSPECQGGYFAPTRSYSPLFNDVWSLGIILLNLITGRNPWKSASADDCTFQAYLKDPHRFLPTVLPISEEVNLLLVRTLEVDWRRRITLREMRLAFKSIDNFYSPDVIFEDSMARCPWEAGLNVDPDSDSSAEAEPEPQDLPEQQEPHEDFASAWSDGSDSEMVFARDGSLRAKGTASWTASFDPRRPEDGAAASSYSRSMSPSPDTASLYTTTKLFEALQTPGQSPASTYSVLSSSPSIPSPPVTPHGGSTWGESRVGRPKLVLTVDTDTHRPEYYDNSVTMLSATASSMHTALDTALEENWDGYMYSPLIASAIATAKPSPYGDSHDDFGMIITPATATEDHDMDEEELPEIDAYDSLPSARPESPVLGLDHGANHERHVDDDAQSEYSWKQIRSWFNPHITSATTTTSTTNNTAFSFFTVHATPAPSRQPSPREPVAWPAFSFGASAAPSSPHSLPEKLSQSRPESPAHRKPRTASFFRPIRLAFPRRSMSPLRRRSRSPARGRGQTRQTESAPEAFANWVISVSTSGSPQPQPYRCLAPSAPVQPTHVRVGGTVEKESTHPTHSTLTEDARPRRKRLRSARDWLSRVTGALPSS